MKKIVITDAQTVTDGDIDLRVFEEFGALEIYPLTAREEAAERIAEADIVLCNKTPMDGDILAQAKNLSYIGLFATGYNNIDLAFAKEHGITVCNAGEYSTNAVAQHTFALLLEHCSRTAAYHSFVAEGNWIRSKTFSPFVYPTEELAGKTMGLIGYGSIGRAVAAVALAFGMRVLVYTRTPKQDVSVIFTDLDTLLASSDVVSVHCPLNEQSKGMFNAEAFAKCRDGAFFINTARGPIVCEAALRDALESGKLSGAGVDVLDYEPMRGDCVLFGAKNLIITPHVAWAPKETRRRLVDIVTENLRGYLSGEPRHVVS